MNTNLMFSSATDEWETPQAFYDELNSESHFTMDVCATPENAKCDRYFTREQDGLSQNWTGETVFCNPPYGREMPKWIEKCAKHGLSGGGIAVMLIPARTDTKAFHQWIYGKAEIRFIKGRLKFGKSQNSAPFPSMIVIFGKEDDHDKQ